MPRHHIAKSYEYGLRCSNVLYYCKHLRYFENITIFLVAIISSKDARPDD